MRLQDGDFEDWDESFKIRVEDLRLRGDDRRVESGFTGLGFEGLMIEG